MSENPRRPPKSSTGTIITVLVIILVGAVYLGWNYLSGNNQGLQETGEVPKVSWLEKRSMPPASMDKAEKPLSPPAKASDSPLC